MSDPSIELEQKLKELEKANQALRANFQHSIELCYSIVKTFYPLLGLQTRSIVNLCDLLTEEDHLNVADKHILRICAWLQNIGFISIHRNILDKYFKNPADLEKRELEMLQKHPMHAETLVKAFTDNLQLVGRNLRSVRERWDGTGYPYGVARENIPVPARYLAVPVYFVESPFPEQETIQNIIDLSGKAFYPEAVRLFLKVTNKVKLPAKVRELLFAELEPGMVLAEGINTPEGVLIYPKDRPLTDDALGKIKYHNASDPIFDRILVYKDH